MSPNLQDTLNAIAQKLDTTADRVFPMLVAKARLDAWICISLGTIFVALGIVVSIWFYRLWKHDDDYLPGLIITPIVIIPLSMLIWMNISNAIYPEAAAIQSIVSSVK